MSAIAIHAVLQPRRLRVLLLVTAANLAVWALVSVFAASEFHRRTIVMGGAQPFDQAFEFQLVTGLVWAVFTPFLFFIAERLPLRPPHRIRNGAIVVALIPLLGVVRAAFGGVVSDLGEHLPISEHMITLSIQIRTHRYIAIVAAILFLSYLAEAQREAAAQERQRLRAQTLLARTEIDELRTRFQPRFAIRMLRHIGGVLRREPQAADALIVTLSGILRRSMGRVTDEQIPLADELDHLDRCLDLCRAGGRVSVTTRYFATEDVLSCRVPALILQPVIETIVVGLTSGAAGAVEVRCTRDGAAAMIELCSTDHDFEAYEQSAAAVRARLANFYGGAASVQVTTSGADVTTSLRIPCGAPT
jgi:two-component system LytT family sensor kinase